MKKKTAIIIGAGPAGLTAAYELLIQTDITPIILEKTDKIGGICQTINYKGNRIDIGGHRFFSKSDLIMQWWLDKFPLTDNDNIKKNDKIMLERNRLSRIYYLKKFFDYPITLNLNNLSKLGIIRSSKIFLSYLKVKLFPIKNETSLEDFFINRFGRELYLTFFKDYTEKLWGLPCREINPEWGAQRVKNVSIKKIIEHALKSMLKKDNTLTQKNTETSFINKFLYPKYGPGQLWEEVVRLIKEQGGKINLKYEVFKLNVNNNKITGVKVKNTENNIESCLEANYIISTIPIKNLINSLGSIVNKDILRIANGLKYRDFITVGMLLNKLKINNENKLIPDNWIYIQEKNVKMGRIQIYNNWSPYLVKDNNTIWLGVEYFCDKGDELWKKNDEEFKNFAVRELESIGIINKQDLLDSVVIRMEKAYPVYSGTYEQFDALKNYLNQFSNFYTIGRNGMHRYNNMDHSMLTAIKAVENIINHNQSKKNIWAVNAENDYHESK